VEGIKMNNRIAILVFLLVVFTIPSFAQSAQSSSDQAGQGSPAIQSMEQREPLKAPQATNFWDGDDPNFVNLVTHPFANKKYVQRYTAPIKDRLNELDEIKSENGNMIKDIDGRSQQGIQQASEKVNLADQHANDAGSKAQGAQTAATEASKRVSRSEQIVANLDQYKATSQTEIRFRPGQSVLSKTAKDALDQLAAPLKDQKSYMIEVRGFSPGHGNAAMASSQAMAASVTRYLVLSNHIPVYRIHALSMGNAPVAGETKHVTGGRVEVNVLTNDLSTTAQR
jgi:outer membrane protein OmpA-like peptidoglycan-associated protein